MKKACWIVLLFFMLVAKLVSQPWVYDFGTGTGSVQANTVSEIFLPSPISGIARVRVGNAGGSINMENPGLSILGAETELRIVASSSTTMNKFQLYNYTPGKVFFTKFDILLGSSSGGRANSGIFYFFQGDGDKYSDSNIISYAQVFSGLQWVFGENSAINTLYRNGSQWLSLGSVPFSQSNVYTVEIYGNNTTASTVYDRNGNSYTIIQNTQDIWVNGTLIGNDLPKGEFADDANIDSFMFNGTTDDSANCFLDNIIYSNVLPTEETLPVELTNFTAAQSPTNAVNITWVSQSESGLLGYYVFRGSSCDFAEALRVSPLILATNTTQQQVHLFSDTELQASGTYFYWLQACDLSGLDSMFGPTTIYLDLDKPSLPGPVLSSGPISIFPNPFNPNTTIFYEIAATSTVTVNIYNLRGQLVRSFFEGTKAPNRYKIIWDGTTESGNDCGSGNYLIEMICGQQRFFRKVVLAK